MRLTRLRLLVCSLVSRFLLLPFRRLRLDWLFEIVLCGGFDILHFVLDLRKTGRLVHLIDFVDVLEVFVLGQREVVLAAVHFLELLLLLLDSLLVSSLLLSNEFFGRHLPRSPEFKLLASHTGDRKCVTTGASLEDLAICFTVGCKSSYPSRHIRFRDSMVEIGIEYSRIGRRGIGYILP